MVVFHSDSMVMKWWLMLIDQFSNFQVIVVNAFFRSFGGSQVVAKKGAWACSSHTPSWRQYLAPQQIIWQLRGATFRRFYAQIVWLHVNEIAIVITDLLYIYIYLFIELWLRTHKKKVKMVVQMKVCTSPSKKRLTLNLSQWPAWSIWIGLWTGPGSNSEFFFKNPILGKKNIYKSRLFHCHVWLLEGSPPWLIRISIHKNDERLDFPNFG